MPSNNGQDNKSWVGDHISGFVLTSLVAVPIGLIRILGGRAAAADTQPEYTPSVPSLDLSISGENEQMVCAAGRVLGAIAAVKHSNVGFMALNAS